MKNFSPTCNSLLHSLNLFFNFGNKLVRYPTHNIVTHKVTEFAWEFVGILFLLHSPSLIFIVSSSVLLLVVSLLPHQSSPDLTRSYSPTPHPNFIAYKAYSDLSRCPRLDPILFPRFLSCQVPILHHFFQLSSAWRN